MLSVMIGGVMACSHRPGELAAGGIVLGNRKVDAGQQLKKANQEMSMKWPVSGSNRYSRYAAAGEHGLEAHRWSALRLLAFAQSDVSSGN